MNAIWHGFEFAIGFMLSIVVLFKAFMWLRFSWYSAKKIDGALYSKQRQAFPRHNKFATRAGPGKSRVGRTANS